jgi:hypothetical protein
VKGRALAALLVSASAPAICAGDAHLARLEGVAVSLPERREVYRELHEIAAFAHRIEYRAPDGTLIARKTLDYRCSQRAPAFEQLDLRSGSRIGGRWERGGYRLLRDDTSRTLGAGDTLVASSGFDRFVQMQWDALARGEAVDFDFALPARLDTLRLRIARTGTEAEAPDAALWLRVVPAQPLLRAFVDPIVLAYDAGRRLLLYRGLSNLDDAAGNAQSVEIRYSHLPARPSGDARRFVVEDTTAVEPFAPGARTTGQLYCEEQG